MCIITNVDCTSGWLHSLQKIIHWNNLHLTCRQKCSILYIVFIAGEGLAVKQFVSEKRRIELKEQMKRGYLEMGDINLEIAENSLLSDESAYEIYEEFLSESENCDSKTR